MAYKAKEGITVGKMYEDLVGDIFSKRLNGTTGKVDYKWDENAIKFQSGGDIDTTVDRVQWDIQIPHGAAIGNKSYFKMHFHWFQETVAGTFTLRYRKQLNGAEKTTAWTDITTTTGTTAGQGSADAFDPSGLTTCNQITTFAEIDISDMNISDTLQFMLARTDTNTGDILVYFVDGHIAKDSRGSTSEWTK